MTQANENREIKPDTKQLLLDAAEGLFAREGFHNTSLRAITARAGVNLAAVNYHFGSKEGLVEEVFKRRLLPLNKIRTERIETVRDRARQEKRRPRAEETLRAFIEPTLRFRDSARGADDFLTLVGRALSEPNQTERQIFLKHVLPIFYLLFETLCEALPGISKDLIFWRLQFSLGAMSHVLCTVGKFDQRQFPQGINPTPDTDSMLSMLMAFLAIGMEA